MSDDELLDQIDTQDFQISAPSAARSPRPSPAVPSPPAGPSRQARAAAAEARLAPRSTGVEAGDQILPGSAELGARCLREKELEWQKFVERELVGPNSYAQAEKVFSMLLRISGNILEQPSNTSFKMIKSSSKKLKSDVLDVLGGREALIHLGFRTQTVDFVEYWTFNPDLLSPSAKSVEKGGRITFAELLRIGHDCLEQKMIVIKERAEISRASVKSAKEEAAEIRARTLVAMEEDRERVARRAAAESRRAHAPKPTPPPQGSP